MLRKAGRAFDLGEKLFRMLDMLTKKLTETNWFAKDTFRYDTCLSFPILTYFPIVSFLIPSPYPPSPPHPPPLPPPQAHPSLFSLCFYFQLFNLFFQPFSLLSSLRNNFHVVKSTKKEERKKEKAGDVSKTKDRKSIVEFME